MAASRRLQRRRPRRHVAGQPGHAAGCTSRTEPRTAIPHDGAGNDGRGTTRMRWSATSPVAAPTTCCSTVARTSRRARGSATRSRCSPLRLLPEQALPGQAYSYTVANTAPSPLQRWSATGLPATFSIDTADRHDHRSVQHAVDIRRDRVRERRPTAGATRDSSVSTSCPDSRRSAPVMGRRPRFATGGVPYCWGFAVSGDGARREPEHTNRDQRIQRSANDRRRRRRRCLRDHRGRCREVLGRQLDW